MSNSTAVQKFYHNFTNKFYDEKDLAKPSREIASAISNYTKKQVENVIGVKTMAAQVKINFFLFYPEKNFEKKDNVF